MHSPEGSQPSRGPGLGFCVCGSEAPRVCLLLLRRRGKFVRGALQLAPGRGVGRWGCRQARSGGGLSTAKRSARPPPPGKNFGTARRPPAARAGAGSGAAPQRRRQGGFGKKDGRLKRSEVQKRSWGEVKGVQGAVCVCHVRRQEKWEGGQLLRKRRGGRKRRAGPWCAKGQRQDRGRRQQEGGEKDAGG